MTHTSPDQRCADPACRICLAKPRLIDQENARLREEVKRLQAAIAKAARARRRS